MNIEENTPQTPDEIGIVETENPVGQLPEEGEVVIEEPEEPCAYIHQDLNVPVELKHTLKDGYEVGETWEDYLRGMWLRLSDEQIDFWKENPEAQPFEIWQISIVVYERTLEEAKQEKLADIELFDTDESGQGVNNFFLNDIAAWINAEKRAIYRASIESAELLGEETIELELGGDFFCIPVATAKIMLARIQRYADKAAIVTAKHKQAVHNLNMIELVDNYDYTVAYPEKETFNI